MNLPIVILPGFLEGAAAYAKLEESIDELGFPSITVPLRRRQRPPCFDIKLDITVYCNP
jgi:hypothetical protein